MSETPQEIIEDAMRDDPLCDHCGAGNPVDGPDGLCAGCRRARETPPTERMQGPVEYDKKGRMT